MLMDLLNKVAATALLGFVVSSTMAMGVGFTIQQIMQSHWVMAQIVMVEHVLITQCNAEDALADQRCHRVLDQLRRPAVGETAGKANRSDRPHGPSPPTAGHRHPR